MAESLGSPLVVEFIGLPGVGKTTVFNQVVQQLRSEGVIVSPRNEILQQWQGMPISHRFLHSWPTKVNHWLVLWRSLGLAFQVKPRTKESFSKAVKIFTNLKRIDKVSGDRRCQLILLDQGLLQEMWSVGITGEPPSNQELKQLLLSLASQRSLAVVDFQIDIETALSRLQNRTTENSRFDRMTPEEAHSMLERYGPYLENICQSTSSVGIPLLQIDGKLAVQEKTEKIANWITSLI